MDNLVIPVGKVIKELRNSLNISQKETVNHIIIKNLFDNLGHLKLNLHTWNLFYKL